MRKNKVIVVTATIVLVTIILIILNHTLRKNTDGTSESDDSYRAELQKSELAGGRKAISNEEVTKYLTGNKDFSEQKVKSDFAVKVVNHDTLNFFQFMDDLFKDANDIPDSLEQARKYLYSILPSAQAQQMLDLYKTYINYQIDIQAKMKEWVKTHKPDEALVNLAQAQSLRRTVFGKENAEIIFGAREKADEYTIRRQMILGDDKMYGFEKERKLRILNEMMWGNETMPFDENLAPYARYQEKKNLYGKDLADARTDAEREAMLAQFRREIFTPEQLQRMEEVEHSVAEETEIKEKYNAREKEIQSDTSISQETKEMKVRELQDATFGEESDAVRRQQAIQKGFDEAKKQAELEAQQAQFGPQPRSMEEALEKASQKILEEQREAEQQEALEQSKIIVPQ